MGRTTFRRSFRLAVVVGAILLLLVAIVGEWEWWLSQHQPSREPDFRGRIVAEDGPGYLLESPRGGHLWFRPPPRARIRTRNDEVATLAVGQSVTLWHASYVRATDPPQVDAVWVIIEPDEAKAQ